ncbi:hypothetical protein KOW79_005351 [Hemibagrus wyckioides]|uniref:Dynein regulatory complex protein 1 C-terminal domain-containing protein n=1 Tax=Hemibagrus wyckioides TaxID=337641 RepID=A0A9D3P2M0_9TELE|nr:hypothetical protein KOW79_005351 [Hemibagrus wyckioides]
MLERMNDSEVKAYWENITNVIPESKLKVWRALEAGLKKHQSTETSRVLLKKKAEAGPSAETRIEARRKRVAARVQARKRSMNVMYVGSVQCTGMVRS